MEVFETFSLNCEILKNFYAKLRKFVRNLKLFNGKMRKSTKNLLKNLEVEWKIILKIQKH